MSNQSDRMLEVDTITWMNQDKYRVEFKHGSRLARDEIGAEIVRARSGDEAIEKAKGQRAIKLLRRCREHI